MPPSYIRVRAVVWVYGRRQTDTQMHVTTIHFASSTTHAKCNQTFWCSLANSSKLYFKTKFKRKIKTPTAVSLGLKKKSGRHLWKVCSAILQSLTKTIKTTTLHPFNGLFFLLGKPAPESKLFRILLEQEMMGWQRHQLDHMQIIYTSLQTCQYLITQVLTGQMPFLPPNQQKVPDPWETGGTCPKSSYLEQEEK